MAFDPDFETIAGSKLAILPGRPTADTAEAYGTLFTGNAGDEFEITSVGGVEGKSFNTSELTVVSSGRNRQKPGTFSYPQGDFGIVWLPESDAQVAAETAMNARDICSFRLTRQSGAIVYFTGYVLNLSEGGGGSDDALTGTLSILRDSETRRVAAP